MRFAVFSSAVVVLLGQVVLAATSTESSSGAGVRRIFRWEPEDYSLSSSLSGSSSGSIDDDTIVFTDFDLIASSSASVGEEAVVGEVTAASDDSASDSYAGDQQSTGTGTTSAGSSQHARKL